MRWEDSFLYRATGGDIRKARLIDSEDFGRIETVLDPGEWEYRSVISAPLFVGDRLFGVLNLDSPVSGTYNTEDVSIVEQFRSQIEIGLLPGSATPRRRGCSPWCAPRPSTGRRFERQQQLDVELQHLDAYRISMIATISHELESPLTAVSGHLELMSSLPDLPPEGVHSTAVMHRGVERLGAWANSSVELTRLEQSEEPRQELVDLDALLAGTVELLEVVAAGDSVRIDHTPAPGPVHVLGDADELHRALADLVGHAIKYSNVGDTVVIGVQHVDDEVVLSCADQGLGISAPDQTRLFTEFFRSTNQQALDRPGTGLGLALVQRIVVRHRGRVELTSELGVGTTFKVHLPAAFPPD
ncbi:MAG: ATP-binding region, ATPase domain protein [Nocardioides sp.]|uniref:ATP-binding protein n=1 Tax=Nocardioides sp. TaxID=35761 RepID=UPI0026143D05|nr:ATP-binding protein [Nocardioides sp.]MCW2832553.1 ATP-binding region, ATPase domain protein [Nocardioides sp.]